MNISSSLRFPPEDRFLQIRQSLKEPTKGNDCANALIGFFAGWHKWKGEQERRMLEYAEMFGDVPEKAVDTGRWQCHTDKQLVDGLFGHYRQDTINKALEFLEKDLRWISTDVPEKYKMIFKTGRRKWFLLDVDKINEYFDKVTLDAKEFFFAPALIKKKINKKDATPKETDTQGKDAMRVFDYWRFYSRPKEGVRNAVASVERLRVIRNRLKEGFTVEQLCEAIEGCLASPFHQGENDKQAIYDRIELIFKSASEVERFMNYNLMYLRSGVPDIQKYVKERLEQMNASDAPQTPASGISENTIDAEFYLAESIYDGLAEKKAAESVAVSFGMSSYGDVLIKPENIFSKVADICEEKVGIYNSTHQEYCAKVLNYLKSEKK